MAKAGIYNFEVRNKDVLVRFSCRNYGHRIRECVQNLQIGRDMESKQRIKARYATSQDDIQFRFSQGPLEGEWLPFDNEIQHTATFFENTEYIVKVVPRKERVGIVLNHFFVGKDQTESIMPDDDLIYGSLNFHNQVGNTDFRIEYEVEGEAKSLCFTTEVLSYKMDYRTDMRQVIKDIEEEYSMLSYDLLKQTYLNFRLKSGDSSDLIWWQIFRECFNTIVDATNIIINNPKRRLKTTVRYERADRLPRILPDQENEYAEFMDDPTHLYRNEEMYLSKDTVENRFLKYAIKEVYRRFDVVKGHILNTLKAGDHQLVIELGRMNEKLNRLSVHPFFHQIGQFKGFSQDSLVMKQARGYKEIHHAWILLQCGYEMQQGLQHLEVKDISELYEIWCFIKVKNIIKHILKDEAEEIFLGKQLTNDFIKQLVQGTQSEVVFRQGDINLASVMYNATTENETSEYKVGTSAIEDTTSKTTEQRPDIVLRLRKKEDRIVYTYLFDAKYRLNDSRIGDPKVDVPPEDAINQLHRYRDAIYFEKSEDQKLKKEIIGGYVLYPGNMNKEEFENSYYHRSIKEVNIGAFPLKPGNHWITNNDELLVSDSSSEQVLYHQIKTWLEDEHPQAKLLDSAIAQKGLNYCIEESNDSYFFIATVDTRVNDEDAIKEGKASEFTTGNIGPMPSVNLQSIKFFAPEFDHYCSGYYVINSIQILDLGPNFENPTRVKFCLGEYKKLPVPKAFSILRHTDRGEILSRKLFLKCVFSDEMTIV